MNPAPPPASAFRQRIAWPGGTKSRGVAGHDRVLTAAGLCLAAAVGALIGTEAYLHLAVLVALAASVTLASAYRAKPGPILVGLWAFLLLQDSAVALVGRGSDAGQALSLADNFFLAVLLVPAIACLLRDRPPCWRLVLGAGGGFLAAGLLSATLSTAPLYVSLTGAFLATKFYIVLAISLAVPWTASMARRAAAAVIGVGILVALSGITDFASGGYLRGLLDADIPEKERLGFTPAGAIFHNVAILGTFMSLSIVALLARSGWRPRARYVLALAAMVLAAILTLRVKAFFTVPAGVLALAIVMPQVRRQLWPMAIGVIVLFVVAGQLIVGITEAQLTQYTSSSTTPPRQVLLETSVDIAQDNFPIGAGFGRFGSAASIDPFPYSPVYHAYGVSGHYGLAPDAEPTYALDTTWAPVLGESGVIGSAAFVGGILLLLSSLYRAAVRRGSSGGVAAAGFAVLCVLLVDSLARPTFVEVFSVVTAALVLGPAIRLGIGRSERQDRDRGLGASHPARGKNA